LRWRQFRYQLDSAIYRTPRFATADRIEKNRRIKETEMRTAERPNWTLLARVNYPSITDLYDFVYDQTKIQARQVHTLKK